MDFNKKIHISPAFLYEAIGVVDFGQGPNIIDIKGESVLNQHKVLFVDDEENILKSLRRLFLEVDSLEVFMAQNGEEALEILGANKVDLIIADQRMPGMSGKELLEQVKNKFPNILRIMLTGYADLESIVEAVNKGEVYRFLTKPWDDEELKVTITNALGVVDLKEQNRQMSVKIQSQNEELKELNESLEKTVKKRTGQLEQAVTHLKGMSERLKQNLHGIIDLLSSIMTLTHRYLGAHTKRVAELSKMISEHLDISVEQKEAIFYAGQLHDIGLIAYQDVLPGKQKKEFSSAEQKLYKQHSIIGQKIISSLKGMETIGKNVRSHHESYDGSGFPDGLMGTDIPIGARVLRLANDYDHHIYSHGNSLEEAAQLITTKDRSCYDRTLVEILKQLIDTRVKKNLERSPEKVVIKDLKPGMYLSGEIVLENGMLLVPKGVVVNQLLIDKIFAFASILNLEKTISVQ